MARQQFCGRTRREFVWETGAGFTGLALGSLLTRDGIVGKAAASIPRNDNAPLAVRPAHAAPRAKRCIFLFMYGGPPQMDLFDYKPVLNRLDGKTANVEWRNGNFKSIKLLGTRRTFRRYGESGQWCSDALPHLSQHMDKIAVLKSLHNDTFAHGSAMIQMNSGRVLQGHPALGSWLGYGLGSPNDNLPAFVVMLDPRGGPIAGAANWTSGYMPAAYQGTVFRPTGDPVLHLSPASRRSSSTQRRELDALRTLNAEHLETRPGYSELQARVASYELAYQMQTSAPEALDLSSEDARTLDLYGVNDPKPSLKDALGPGPFGRQCLIARRLIERGVPFVQIYSGGGHGDQNWDAHSDVERNLKIHGPEIDKPMAALLMDLEQRGLLDETLVVWGGEFGRQAVQQNGVGRDHNPKGFTYWLAGGGVRGGTSYGETDDIGHVAAVNPRHVRDLHATILHLMGLDHHELSYFYGGLDQRLTGVEEAHVIEEILS